MAKDKAETKPRDICEGTFSFAAEIVTLCRKLEQADSAARALARQLIRSGTSVGPNVEEAQGGQSRADFISKYAIARKEARETRYWLRLLAATSMALGHDFS
jgi:four helix bundle protein